MCTNNTEASVAELLCILGMIHYISFWKSRNTIIVLTDCISSVTLKTQQQQQQLFYGLLCETKSHWRGNEI